MVSHIRSMPPPDLSERGQYPLSGGRCFAALVRVSAQGRTKIAVCRNQLNHVRIIDYCDACSSPIVGMKRSLLSKAGVSYWPGWYFCPCLCQFARLCSLLFILSSTKDRLVLSIYISFG